MGLRALGLVDHGLKLKTSSVVHSGGVHLW